MGKYPALQDQFEEFFKVKFPDDKDNQYPVRQSHVETENLM